MGKKIVVVGSSNTDMTIKGDKLPVPGETVAGGVFYAGQGGKGANQAVAARRLGGEVAFVCKVGNDIFAENSLKSYVDEGIDISGVLRSKEASGVALILVDASGENCISVASGANGDFTVADVDSVAGIIKSADILVLQLEIPVPSVLAAAKIAREGGAYVILNPAPACPLPKELFRYASLMVPNQTELSLLSGINCDSMDKVKEAVAELKRMGVGDVVVTLGSKGSLVCAGSTFETVEAQKVKAVDATAAGDTFCGGLAVGLSEGLSLVDAARFATRASAITVQRPGAQNSIPYRKEL